MKLVVGISGASGAPYARRLLEVLGEQRPSPELHVVLSRTAPDVWRHECGGRVEDLGWPTYGGRDYQAPCASGSAGFEAMVVVPASMSCLARIAHGISDDLLTRAADVMLKERRKLIVVPREAPYGQVHIENMLALSKLGALVLPASPAFYGQPRTLEDLIDSVVGRLLDQLGIEHALSKRWGQDVVLGDGAALADEVGGQGRDAREA